MTALPNGLALNPSAQITVFGGDSSPEFLVSAPVRGTAFAPHHVRRDNLPDAHAFLVETVLSGNAAAQVDGRCLDELRRIGLFAPPELIPAPVQYGFPQASPGQSTGSAPEGFGLPPGQLRVPESWSSLPLVLEPHTRGGIWAPALATLDEGPCALPDAPPEMDDRSTCATFAREGFALLPDLLPAAHVSALGAYFQALAREGYLERHDDRGTHRHIAHNHPVADFWHDQLNARVSHLVGRKTKPSYTYVSLYIEGGDLEWHTDRPPCEYTITLLLDYAPLRGDGCSPWALKVRGRDGTVHEIHQRIGDALIFKGRELQHSRESLPAGHRSASLLFHFVDHDYEGILV